MRVDITFTMHCSIEGCGETDTQHFPYQRCEFGSVMRLPVLPDGWVEVGRQMVCAKHTLVLSVDGQEQAIV